MNRQYMQVGNAVPVQLGAAIGKAVLSEVEETSLNRNTFDMEMSLALAIKRLKASARNKRGNASNQQLKLF